MLILYPSCFFLNLQVFEQIQSIAFLPPPLENQMAKDDYWNYYTQGILPSGHFSEWHLGTVGLPMPEDYFVAPKKIKNLIYSWYRVL